ncbi:efflux RND transporter periplasmic adaptor subunit [Pseudomonas matsuisoli]|uniref:efflux RND transporter periplasmic adaptor subunit n=1 Tax=Pseudomonas matsuisoli TaxID=1515666 RepID=UPI001669F979|nr:efflux RND transporter periplasmic adaptor subunit [Pseudomonas matsuisoli]
MRGIWKGVKFHVPGQTLFAGNRSAGRPAPTETARGFCRSGLARECGGKCAASIYGKSTISAIRLAFLLLLPFAITACSDDPPPEPPIRPVLYVEVKPQQQETIGRFAGSIQARYETTLGFRVGGRIAERRVDVGAKVSAGDELASLDPTDQQNALRASQGDAARSQAQFLNAEADAKRQQQLFDRGVGAKAQLDQAITQLSSARAARDQADAAARQAADRVGYGTLHADHDSVVNAWHVEVGQVVGAGQDVVTLARPDVREAVFDLPAYLVDKLRHEPEFTIESQLEPEVRTTGHIREVEPQADPATRTQRVRLTLDQTPEQFYLGTAITVMLSRPIDARTWLPSSAVQDQDGKLRVWVVDPEAKTVQPRDVEVLAREGDRVSVNGSLKPGERVVSAGVNFLKPGQKVRMDEGVQP